MTLCDLCKFKTHRIGNSGDWYCADRTSEKFRSCDLNTNFAPFVPMEGLKYSRDYIVSKWAKHVEKLFTGE